MKKNDKFRRVDLAFVVDTTGSMGSFIDEAKTSMVNILKSISSEQNIDLAVGVVEYKDHCDTVVSKSYGITTDMEDAQKMIKRLYPGGGGDEPEAVFDGLNELSKMEWREYSKRVAVLVGDNPPHGYASSGDSYPKGCPCKLTLEDVTSAMENLGIVLNSFPVRNDKNTIDSFKLISSYTGGELFKTSASVTSDIKKMLVKEFDEIDFDIKVYDALIKTQDFEVVVKKLESNRIVVSGAIGRLISKGLISFNTKTEKWISKT